MARIKLAQQIIFTKISEITEIYKAKGKGKTPVMIIQNGSMNDRRTVIGTIHNIESKINESGLQSPSVLIIGEVVKHASFINSMNKKLYAILMPQKPKVKGEFSMISKTKNYAKQLISCIS